MPVFLDIEPIKFNGSIFCRIELTGSAIKHYESDSGKYYEYIVSSLNGQNRQACCESNRRTASLSRISHKKNNTEAHISDKMLLNKHLVRYRGAPMNTECTADQLEFQGFKKRKVVVKHDVEISSSDGTVEILKRIILIIRKRFPPIQIILRGDSGFCREEIMRFCGDNNIYYIFGLARNKRLHRAIAGRLKKAKALYDETNEAQRIFCELKYKTRKSWSRIRRVVGKAEYLAKGENPRFVVTNLSIEVWPAKELYEDLYCARGDMENRIKEQQLYLFADRTSTAWMSSNQLRLWFSSFAYMFFVLLRTEALCETELEREQAATLLLKILKVAAIVKVSTRRILIRLPSAYPY